MVYQKRQCTGNKFEYSTLVFSNTRKMEMQPMVFPTYQVPNGFWPFSGCGIKGMELPIHPAFMNTPHSNFPFQTSTTSSSSTRSSKSDSFSIDAILNRDRNSNEVPKSPEDTKHNFAHSNTNRFYPKDDSPTITRRHIRMHGGQGHPYMTPDHKRSGQLSPIYGSALEKKFRQHYPIAINNVKDCVESLSRKGNVYFFI